MNQLKCSGERKRMRKRKSFKVREQIIDKKVEVSNFKKSFKSYFHFSVIFFTQRKLFSVAVFQMYDLMFTETFLKFIFMKTPNEFDLSIIEGQKANKNVIDISWDDLLTTPQSTSSKILKPYKNQSDQKESLMNALAELQKTTLFHDQAHDIYSSNLERSGQKLKSQIKNRLGINQNFLKNNIQKLVLDFQDEDSQNPKICYGVVQCCECKKFNLVDLLEEGYLTSITEELLKPKMMKTPKKKTLLNSPKSCKKTFSSSKTTPSTPRNLSNKSQQKDKYLRPKLKIKPQKQKKKSCNVENQYFKKKQKKLKKN